MTSPRPLHRIEQPAQRVGAGAVFSARRTRGATVDQAATARIRARMSMSQSIIDELERRRAVARQGGGEARIANQHKLSLIHI